MRDRDRRTITAADVRDLASACHAQLSSGALPPVARSRTSRRVRLAAAAVALAVVASGIAWWVQRNAKVRWARQEALPEIIRLAGADKFDAAYTLAQQAQPYIPDDPLLAEQIRGIARRGGHRLRTGRRRCLLPPVRPERRAVAAAREDADRRGQRATRAAALERPAGGPRDRGGRRSWPVRVDGDVRFALFPPDKVPAGMVRIASPGPTFQIVMPSLEHLSAVQLPDYWIDRHEVTNRAFKRFVDDGGYRRAELWREPFVKDGRTLTFDEAMKHFRDATGQPGPAEWEQGTYAAGQDEYPVGGVSWYEAAAYARWAGKSLPTIYHWTRAADLRLSGDVVPASNFSGKSPIPVGTSRRHHPRRHA